MLRLCFARSSVLEAGQQSALHLSLVLHKPGPFFIAWRTRWVQDGFSSPLNTCLCSGKDSRRVLHCNFSCKASVVLVPSRAWGQDLSENLHLGGCFPFKVCICELAAGRLRAPAWWAAVHLPKERHVDTGTLLQQHERWLCAGFCGNPRAGKVPATEFPPRLWAGAFI